MQHLNIPQRQGTEGTHLSEPQKHIPTGEFVIVAVCCFILSSVLVTVGRAGSEAGMQENQNVGIRDFKKKTYPAARKK